MRRAGSHPGGFTLLELVVAMTILLLLGLGAHTLLQLEIKAREVSHQRAERLAQLQKAVTLIALDLTQAEPDSIAIPDPTYMAGFVRRGWSNPLGLPRSDLLRVGYALQGTTLTRYYASADHPAAPEVQPLLEGVTRAAFRELPRAVELTLWVQDFGEVRRVIEVPEP